eukprot:921631-Pleurochrysis_carterae.AAC.1
MGLVFAVDCAFKLIHLHNTAQAATGWCAESVRKRPIQRSSLFQFCWLPELKKRCSSPIGCRTLSEEHAYKVFRACMDAQHVRAYPFVIHLRVCAGY